MIATAENLECGIFFEMTQNHTERQGWVLLSFSPSRLKKPQHKTCYVCCEKCRSQKSS